MLKRGHGVSFDEARVSEHKNLTFSGLISHIPTLGPGLKLLHVFSLMLTPGPSRLGVCTKTVAVYKASEESPSKQY